ncbi:MAG: hypothetical protein MUE85_20655 [Microscillaceae bacterium]|jgi:hypothetical protein|nr:hypothetical protein [Microscillaceae bacterium]
MQTYQEILESKRPIWKYDENVIKIVSQKFFALQDSIRAEFFEYYRANYGNIGYEKLLNDFPNWQVQQAIPERFYEGVHNFVTHFLEKNDLCAFLENEFWRILAADCPKVGFQTIAISDLAQVYVRVFNDLNALDITKVKAKKHYRLDYEGLDCFLECFKYIQMLRLQQSCAQVYQDIPLIMGRLQAEFYLGEPKNCEIRYLIDHLGVEIKLNHPYIHFFKAKDLPFFGIRNLSMPDIQGDYEEVISQYLNNEGLKLAQAQRESMIYKDLITNDLKMFLAQYHQYKKTGRYIDLSSTFRATGGWLWINFKIN